MFFNTYRWKTNGSLPKKKAELVATYQVWNSVRMSFSFREYCEIYNEKNPEKESVELDFDFGRDSDSKQENLEEQVASSLLELAGQKQSD